MLLILLLGILSNIHNTICHGDDAYEISLGKSCFPFDSCKASLATTCKCDDHCGLYGDCCSDSPYSSSYGPEIAFLCRNKDSYRADGVYVKSVCPRDNVENWIREKCEGTSQPDDIELQVPVFSSFSLITYKNYHCALCNNDKDNLIFWDVAFSCNRPSDENEIMENLVYSGRDGSWGFWESPDGKNTWVSCKLSPQLSRKIPHYRGCVNSISECDPKWQDNEVRNICSSHESRMVSKDGNTYKNVHCALCNNVDLSDLDCEPMETHFQYDQAGYGYSGFSPRGIPVINFGDLLDINLNKGNKIEKLKKCPSGQVYDDILGKCVQTFCIGNRVPKGGKCVVP